MSKNILQKYAYTLVNYSLNVKSKEFVIIKGTNITLPLMKECYREILKVGAFPQIMIAPEGINEILLKEGNEEQISFVSPLSETYVEKADKVLNILGGYNTRALSNVSPQKISMQRKGGTVLNKRYRERIENGELDWTLCLYPTQSGAQEANMSLDEFEEFIHHACFLDESDPIKKWKELHDEQQKMVEYLSDKSIIRAVSKDTDITVNTKDRIWINSDGHNNFPSGEVFTAPHIKSINGKIRFSFPGIYAGKAIEDIALEFEDGEIISATAKTGEDLLKTLINTDEGSKYIGEFAIGTNYGIQKFTKNMLFDEKIGGTIHMAIGSAYGECGGINESVIHWDMLCDMRDEGKIYADGELFYENGKFIKK
jgi:aminopeptidase